MSRISAGRAELEDRPYTLYRFFDRQGVLLYIGITVDFKKRHQQHARYKKWWSQVDHDATVVEYFNGQRAALDAERKAIQLEKPLENDRHNEFVEISEDEEVGCRCGAEDLPAVIYDRLDAEERDTLLAEVRRTPVDDRIYEQEHVEFASTAFAKVTDDRDRLEEAVTRLWRELPPDLTAKVRDIAISEIKANMGEDHTRFDIIVNVLRHLGYEMNRRLAGGE